MLTMLRNQIRRWLDKDDLERYRQNPWIITIQSNLTRLQVVAALQSDPTLYDVVQREFRVGDRNHGYELLRIAATHDISMIRKAADQRNIPPDLLLEGLKSEEVWESILANWIAYNNPQFSEACPKEAVIIQFCKDLGMSAKECKDYYEMTASGKSVPQKNLESELPSFG